MLEKCNYVALKFGSKIEAFECVTIDSQVDDLGVSLFFGVISGQGCPG